ncbi:MAG TPA: hypothetical protein VJR92_07475 [Gemmatimonadaceae bacterium]|nr:hypothetical protein [Gemmatimonadaceae bacterium]
MASIRIVVLCLCAAVAYGVLHDQVTVRISLEYFTIAHPPLISSNNPTLLALTWGVVATWWVGLPLGALLAVAARGGPTPKASAADIVPFVKRLLLAMAVAAALSALVGWILAAQGAIAIPPAFTQSIAPDRQARFVSALWAHSASYFVGIAGGVVCAVAARLRRERTREATI